MSITTVPLRQKELMNTLRQEGLTVLKPVKNPLTLRLFFGCPYETSNFAKRPLSQILPKDV